MFSQPITPPKNVTLYMNGTVLDSEGNEVPILDVKVLADRNSDEKHENVTFDWQIVEFYPNEMRIKLNFTDAHKVSMSEIIDRLSITFRGHKFFFNQRGLTVKSNRVVEKDLPPQLADTTFNNAMKTTAFVLAGAVTVSMTFTFIVNFILGASMQQLWSAINT